jgi:hypothetical protein
MGPPEAIRPIRPPFLPAGAGVRRCPGYWTCATAPRRNGANARPVAATSPPAPPGSGVRPLLLPARIHCVLASRSGHPPALRAGRPDIRPVPSWHTVGSGRHAWRVRTPPFTGRREAGRRRMDHRTPPHPARLHGDTARSGSALYVDPDRAGRWADAATPPALVPAPHGAGRSILRGHLRLRADPETAGALCACSASSRAARPGASLRRSVRTGSRDNRAPSILSAWRRSHRGRADRLAHRTVRTAGGPPHDAMRSDGAHDRRATGQAAPATSCCTAKPGAGLPTTLPVHPDAERSGKRPPPGAPFARRTRPGPAPTRGQNRPGIRWKRTPEAVLQTDPLGIVLKPCDLLDYSSPP